MHLPRTQTILIDGCHPFIIQRPYSWQNEHGGWQIGASHAFLCPVCLRVWAKLPMEGMEVFTIHSVPCAQHPINQHTVAGSLIPPTWTRWPLSADEGLLSNLPLPLWQRELSLHLTHLERYQNA